MVVRPLKFTDREGVSYFISASGSVFIELPADKKSSKNPYRKIGFYDFENKVFIKKERYKKDAVYSKLNAFGFPYHLLKELSTNKLYGLEKIIVELEEIAIYSISVVDFFNSGYFLKNNFRNYKNKGLELRIFVPIERFKREVFKFKKQ